MDQAQTRELILESLNAVLSEPLDALPTDSVNFMEDGILDSLDAMNFLFELEKRIGHELEDVGEDFTEFTVSRLSDIILRSDA